MEYICLNYSQWTQALVAKSQWTHQLEINQGDSWLGFSFAWPLKLSNLALYQSKGEPQSYCYKMAGWIHPDRNLSSPYLTVSSRCNSKTGSQRRKKSCSLPSGKFNSIMSVKKLKREIFSKPHSSTLLRRYVFIYSARLDGQRNGINTGEKVVYCVHQWMLSVQRSSLKLGWVRKQENYKAK